MQVKKVYHFIQMKKTIYLILSAVFLLSCGLLKAQVIGIESPIAEKNIFIGIKGGVNAMDMVYRTNENSFVNHSVLYQRPYQALSCLVGGITVERTTPRFSYGAEVLITGLNAQKPADESRYAEHDSAFFANLRIPVRLNLFTKSRVVPYVFVAPQISTYIDAKITDKIGFKGYSKWNGVSMDWGRRNAAPIHLSVLAGLGINYKIDIKNYEVLTRLEAGYQLGLLNTLPSNINMSRKARGWEATISLSFPLFTNPHYSWLM